MEGIINGIFFNQGHVCCAGSRLFVQESVYKTVLRKLKDRMESLIVGDPLDKNTDIGAINSKQQLEVINQYLKIGQQEGAEMYQSSCAIPKRDSSAAQQSLPTWRSQTASHPKKYSARYWPFKHSVPTMK